LFQEKARLMQRRIIAPAQEVEIDRSGRIIIPNTLREFAGLKKDCIILGIQTYLEIWDEASYAGYLAENEKRFKEAAEEIGNKIAL
jgi:MraZ protein